MLKRNHKFPNNHSREGRWKEFDKGSCIVRPLAYVEKAKQAALTVMFVRSKISSRKGKLWSGWEIFPHTEWVLVKKLFGLLPVRWMHWDENRDKRRQRYRQRKVDVDLLGHFAAQSKIYRKLKQSISWWYNSCGECSKTHPRRWIAFDQMVVEGCHNASYHMLQVEEEVTALRKADLSKQSQMRCLFLGNAHKFIKAGPPWGFFGHCWS